MKLLVSLILLGSLACAARQRAPSPEVRHAFVEEIGAIGTLALKNKSLNSQQLEELVAAINSTTRQAEELTK